MVSEKLEAQTDHREIFRRVGLGESVGPGDSGHDHRDKNIPPSVRLGRLDWASKILGIQREVGEGAHIIVEVWDGDHWYLLRTTLQGVAGKVCQAAGVSIPPSMQLWKNVVPTDNPLAERMAVLPCMQGIDIPPNHGVFIFPLRSTATEETRWNEQKAKQDD